MKNGNTGQSSRISIEQLSPTPRS